MTVDIASFPGELQSALEEISSHTNFISSSPKGNSGFVIFGKNKITQRKEVIKIYFWDEGAHPEPKILAQLEHENILKIYHGASVNDEWAYFTTKHCEGGDLDAVLTSRKLGTKEACNLAIMIAAGVAFLHGNNFLHRDLKPENLYMDGSIAVIGDFGSVAPCDADGYCKTWTRHSLIYRPPEALRTNEFYKASDVYQLGILLYQLLGGYFPYLEREWLSDKKKKKYDELKDEHEQNQFATEEIEKRISAGRILDMTTLPACVPDSTKTVVRKATNINRADRYSNASDFLAALNNVKNKIRDWRFEDYMTLYSKGKKVRVYAKDGKITIEKNVGSQWREFRKKVPSGLKEAVHIAESL